MKKILIISAHPNNDSFTQSVADKFEEVSKQTGNEVKSFNIYNFEIPFYEYNEDRYNVEPSQELKETQNDIIWADHIVFVYPIWWASIPAKLKAFIENVFQVGVVADFDKNTGAPIPRLKGKTATVIQSYDMPYIIMRLLGHDAPFNTIKLGILNVCGVKVTKRFDFDMMRKCDENKIKYRLYQIEKYVEELK